MEDSSQRERSKDDRSRQRKHMMPTKIFGGENNEEEGDTDFDFNGNLVGDVSVPEQSSQKVESTGSTGGGMEGMSLSDDVHNSEPLHNLQSLSANSGSGKASAFAQLVRTWETYMNDGSVSHLQPLQMFHNLNLCGTGKQVARLGSGGGGGPPAANIPRKGRLLEPIVLRHTHSTPLRKTSSNLDDDEDLPPPVGPELTNRSRSTPLSMSANSAFGTALRTGPSVEGKADRSAFTLPPYRFKQVKSNETTSLQTLFNPIRYDKEMEVERTAIEVMDVPSAKLRFGVQASNAVPALNRPGQARPTAASRAARFLSEVRNLHLRRRNRGGRENPARPPSVSEESLRRTVGLDEGTASSKSSFSSSSRASLDSRSKSSIGHMQGKASGRTNEHTFQDAVKYADAIGSRSLTSPSYHPLDSDTDDGSILQGIRLSTGSPTKTSFPSYSQMEDDDPSNRSVGRVRIQVSNDAKQGAGARAAESILPFAAASPEPSQSEGYGNALSHHPHDSPSTSRCSATTYTSGHTTYATSTTHSTGHNSHLSAISETDREVMEVNNKLGAPEHQEDEAPLLKNPPHLQSIPLSASRNARLDAYPKLPGSPVNQRDGASVPAERFFTFVDSQVTDKRGNGRNRALSSSRIGTCSSPTTVSSSSMTTNSSASSAGDEPPAFVSCLDRKMASDLTSLRESAEASSPRAGGDDDSERRESSPAKLMGYSDVLFEAAEAPRQVLSKKPRPIWPGKGFHFGRRVRSLPPRSPLKGRQTPTTPPPPRSGSGSGSGSDSVSPAGSGVSPPRNIVDHRMEQNISKPYVLRTAPASSRLRPAGQKVSFQSYATADGGHLYDMGIDHGAQEVVRVATGEEFPRNYNPVIPRVPSPVNARPRTYDESSIEILKTDSKDSSSPSFVHPDEVA